MIDEAIAHAKEVAKRNRADYKNCPADRRDIEHQTCEECAKEHEQLAKWLEELKELRELLDERLYEKLIYSKVKEDSYNKAIDDFVRKVKEHQYVLSDVINNKDYGMFTVGIEQIAEQLKEKSMYGEAVKEQSLSDRKERMVTSDKDCADCLCRVCARNNCNDSYNLKLEDGRSCECNCKIGDKLIETEDDCPDFLPDENM